AGTTASRYSASTRSPSPSRTRRPTSTPCAPCLAPRQSFPPGRAQHTPRGSRLPPRAPPAGSRRNRSDARCPSRRLSNRPLLKQRLQLFEQPREFHRLRVVFIAAGVERFGPVIRHRVRGQRQCWDPPQRLI